MSPHEHFYDGKDKGIAVYDPKKRLAITLIEKRIDACDILIECVKAERGGMELHFQEREPLLEKLRLLRKQLDNELFEFQPQAITK